ncbi:sigma-54-dependent Fis family transcriptional regulator, partial [Cypionkella sp.]|uniref:sigma-54-dependent Fis family transcriptional regulator n=1 Tax=Cypionkella sp. TaxID=2811411 RepID=UPI002ABA1CEF
MKREIEQLHRRFEPNAAPIPALVQDSWARCLDTYHLLPDARRHTTVLTHGELREAVEQQADLVLSATPEINRLFQRLVQGEHIVSLASSNGTKLLFRCAPPRLADLNAAGVLPGSIWSEEAEGTNGIGLCLKLGRAVSVVGGQHFHQSLKGLTCSVAPIFGLGGQVEAVLNVSSLQPETDRSAHLLQSIVERAAWRIEIQHFRRRNSQRRLINLAHEADFGDTAAQALVAIDEAGRIVDLTSNAPSILRQPRAALLDRRIDHVLELGSHSDQMVVSQPSEDLFARWEAPAKRHAPPTRTQRPLRQGLAWMPDPRHHELMARAERLLAGNQPLIILGETGVGKTLFAQALADRIPRRSLFLNCTADPSETSAALRQLQAEADYTLVLDHADEMPPALQNQLLALLADDDVLGSRGISLITVSKNGLAAQVNENRLRSDLAHRLDGSALCLPPLRQSVNLTEIITAVFATEASSVGRALSLSPAALAALLSHHWPGNL